MAGGRMARAKSAKFAMGTGGRLEAHGGAWQNGVEAGKMACSQVRERIGWHHGKQRRDEHVILLGNKPWTEQR